jgi:hypothetical protein
MLGSGRVSSAKSRLTQRPEEGYRFRDSYLDLLAEHYGAGLWTLEHRCDPVPGATGEPRLLADTLGAGHPFFPCLAPVRHVRGCQIVPRERLWRLARFLSARGG